MSANHEARILVPRSGKVAENLARLILEAIVAGNLPPGSMLPPEAQMVETYGVGRASLREALRILEVHGLIRVKPGPGGGPVVADVTSENFGATATFYFHATRANHSDLLEARLALEPMMTRLAAQRMQAHKRERLIANIAKAEELLDDPGPLWGQVSAEFHELIAGCSGNPILDMMGSSLSHIHAERVRTMFPAGDRGGVLKAHRGIANAILAGDVDKAEQVAARHIQEIIKQLGKLNPWMLKEIITWR